MLLGAGFLTTASHTLLFFSCCLQERTFVARCGVTHVARKFRRKRETLLVYVTRFRYRKRTIEKCAEARADIAAGFFHELRRGGAGRGGEPRRLGWAHSMKNYEKRASLLFGLLFTGTGRAVLL